MLYAFTLKNGRLDRLSIEVDTDLAALSPVWIDIHGAADEEVARVEQAYALTLPTPEHLRDIEASARFYEQKGWLHLRSDFLLGTESHAHSVAVAFMLADATLISIHDEDLPIFRLLRLRMQSESRPIESSRDVLIDLFGMDIEFSADALEGVYADLGRVSQRVLSDTLSDAQAREALAEIAHAEHVNGRIRRNVMDIRRALSFLLRTKSLNTTQIDEVRQIQQDIDSLDGHTAFLFDKINFLMDAVIGFININQNKIVRLFSVVSVALLPPTLIASIYGMNFQFMPELQWKLGYPFALLLMALTVGVPLVIFWRKGWLR
ncbi:MAG: magnesium/cobalt transporter CorA [Gammaproteobacteria bacterium]|nr:magnesium/cobalt transporter CorA [Gammaproteobacteria bacterium]MBU1624278.1 magnesium/cobalt transporter CorA [Gammaproteobacteria bacterium]MBU1981006.1 magnesium/cobalt transporter CorA [Gammaproteobacteria bacterium]